MEKERILKAYNDYIQTDIHRNCEKYRKLSDGKSADVFFADVRARVNLEYMGIVDNKGYMKSYYIDNFKSLRTNSTGYSLKDLVVGNGLLQATTRLYAEYATSKKLVTNQKDFDLIKDFDLDDLLGKTMVIQSWAGKLLLKGVTQLDRFSFYPVTPKDYFPIRNEYNPKLIDGYVIYNLSQDDKSKKTLICEIYELDSIEYRAYKITDNSITETNYPFNLTNNGMVKNGLGYRDKQAQGWAVVEIENIFGTSDYNDDLVGNVRELVIGDTLTSQAFQKVANPLLQVPDSMIEVDKNGRSTVRLDGRVIVVNKDDKEVKQVQLETKTQEWKLHKEDIKNDIYKQLGVNDLAFGIDLGGSISSGEAKRRSLERTIATVESKRTKCITGIKNIILWGYKKLKGKEIDLQIEAQDILSLSLTEKMAIVVQGIQNNVMSLETAIKFLGILGKDTDKEIALIKANVGYQEKLINILNILAGITREEELQVKVDELSKDIMKDLGLEVKEE
nr:MAG TPA: portal protein [Caudoviricetes sp.]